MPRIPTIYLETTIFNFPFADDAPQYREEARRLFTEMKGINTAGQALHPALSGPSAAEREPSDLWSAVRRGIDPLL